MDKTQFNLNKVALAPPAPAARQPSTEESLPLGAAIVLTELEDLIKANFQFYAGRPIDMFEFNAFNSDNRILTTLAQTIETQKNSFTNTNESAFSLDPLNINSKVSFEAFKDNVKSGLMEKGVSMQENIGYSKSKSSSKKVRSISNKFNVNQDSIDAGLFTIQDSTYIRLPMTGDGNCMYYSILIADYLDSVLTGQPPSIVNIHGNPYIDLDNSSQSVSYIFRESMQRQSRNLIVRPTGNLNLDIVARKFKQDLYRSWRYRLSNLRNNQSNLRLGIGHFFKENEIGKPGGGNESAITELLSTMRDTTYMRQIENDSNYPQNDTDDYFNFVFNDGYDINERQRYAEGTYLLDDEKELHNDKLLIIGSKETNPEIGSTRKIWGTVAELLFILIRFRNLRIVVYDINPSMPNQDIFTFDLSNYGITAESDENIKTIYLLYTGIHYDILVNTEILDKI